MTWYCRTGWMIALALLLPFVAFGQAEVQAWGNVTGIRIEGQLMEFETSLRVVGPRWNDISRTAKERQRPSYARRNGRQFVSTSIDSMFFSQVVENVGVGEAHVDVEFTSRADSSLSGVYFSIALPEDRYGSGTVHLIDPADVRLSDAQAGGPKEYIRVNARGLRVSGREQRIEVTTDEPTEIVVRRGEDGNVQVYLAIASGPVSTGQVERKSFLLRANGHIDRRPVHVRIDPSQPGRRFVGLGGNFRLQNPRTDRQVIEYSLENLRVAWARVDMPWMLWHAEEEVDPIEAARAGELHPRVATSMEMAQRAYEMDIPVMLAAWFAPEWAIEGERRRGRGPDGRFGNALRRDKIDRIYASIADYVLYLKEEYGVEVEMFSFNESDLGIAVRQTPEEHAHLLRHLGVLFEERGLKTKLLLGDTADITGYDFVDVAVEDPATHPYIGAVSFHSWRGWSRENLREWDEVAERMDLPLVVGGGSVDAGAWRYPDIFLEETYAREEINLYMRIMALCQPLTILQWQLTADYSPLAGGGIFGNDEDPLHPTQRFWNLKQLASTPEDVRYLPVEVDRSDVTVAAVGDVDRSVYAVHLVNNGPTRKVTLSGLPDGLDALRFFVTDEERGMEEADAVRVVGGEASFTLPETSFTSLMKSE
ncbi:MAG: hypothetical protein WD423_09225 [Rhodothermales bacterium]